MNNKLTILIPTKNRPEWLKRSLLCYDTQKFPLSILIGDSSNKKNYLINKKTCSEFKNLDVKIFNYPKDNVQQTLIKLSKYIDTPFSATVSDDDILVIEGLRKSIKILKSSPGIIGVTGSAKLISVKNSKTFGKIINISNYHMRAIVNSSAITRTNDYLDLPTNIVFCTMRSKQFTECQKFLGLLPPYHQTFFFGEILAALWMLNKGKIYKLKRLYLLRQGHENQNFHQVDMNKFFAGNIFSKSLKIINKQLNINMHHSRKLFNLNQKKILILIVNIFLNRKTNKNKIYFKIFYKVINIINVFIKKTFLTNEEKKYFRIIEKK